MWAVLRRQLDRTVDDALARVVARVEAESARLGALGGRIGACERRVAAISGEKHRATTVLATSKFPAAGDAPTYPALYHERDAERDSPGGGHPEPEDDVPYYIAEVRSVTPRRCLALHGGPHAPWERSELARGSGEREGLLSIGRGGGGRWW